jgi:hypothetical protein
MEREMNAFEPRDWYTLDMATKIRLFSLMFPTRLPRRQLHRELDGTLILPKFDTNLVLWPPPKPILQRHDTSIGAWRVPERAKRVTFQDFDPVFPEPLELPPWHLDRHDTSIGGRVAERA